MKLLRWVLLPFSLLYGFVTGLRNLFYQYGWISSFRIPGKSIVIGNLSVGGTGKTPLVVYLVQHFLGQQIPTATLSRGYGRKTKGLQKASQKSTAEEIGDEPLQYQSRFGDQINVFVAEKRVTGVQAIREISAASVILLDDAYQHRKVTAGLNILVTEFHRPFSTDFLLPVGRLRESKRVAKRADIIIVSKCPPVISTEDQKRLKDQICRFGQPLFFSRIEYSNLQHISGPTPNTSKRILLVTGIGNPTPLREHLELTYEVTHMKFPDHHDFTVKDIEAIHQKFNTFAREDAIIVTTEKDYMRLLKFEAIKKSSVPWFYQPIEIQIDNETQLKNLLDAYVREN